MNTKKDILVSVIIPNYNRIAPLERAIQSVLAQTVNAFEIYVIDDNSDIDPLPVIQGFDDDRIHFIKLSEKKNAAYARNIGISKAKGKFTAFLDSDDGYLPHHFEKRIKLLEENPQYDGTYGSAIKVKKDHQEVCTASQVAENESILEYLLSGPLRACTPSLFLKTIAAREVMFDESLYQHQDYDFNARFHQQYKLLCDPDPSVLVYYDDENKMSNTINHASCIFFIDKYKHTISQQTYYNYLYSRMRQEKAQNGETPYYQEYKKRYLTGENKVGNYLELLAQKYRAARPINKLYKSISRLVKSS